MGFLIGLGYHLSMSTFSDMTHYGIVNMVPILQAEGMSYLENLATALQPKTFLEIGTAIGRTSIQLATLCPDLKVVTIEKDPEMARVARENIQNNGLQDRITLLEGDAREVDFPEIPYDLIFIDAAKGQYRRFFERFSPWLAPGGIIVTDNMEFHGLVEHPERTHNRHTKGLIRRLKDYRVFLENHPDYVTELVRVGDGIAITRRKNDAEMVD